MWTKVGYGWHAEPHERVLLDVVEDETLWWCAVHIDGKVAAECWSDSPELMCLALERSWERLL